MIAGLLYRRLDGWDQARRRDTEIALRRIVPCSLPGGIALLEVLAFVMGNYNVGAKFGPNRCHQRCTRPRSALAIAIDFPRAPSQGLAAGGHS